MGKKLNKNEPRSWTLRILGLFLLGLFFNVVLLVFVLLKEDPIFWRNVGEYPIWLRETVLDSFYPLVVVQFFALVTVSVGLCYVLPIERSIRLAALAGIAVLWLWFGIVLTILVWNNVDNLINGRDLHYHPPFQLPDH